MLHLRLEALISLFFLPYSWTSIRLKLLQARDRFAQFEQATANRSASQPTPLYVIDCDGRFSEEDFEHLYKVLSLASEPTSPADAVCAESVTLHRLPCMSPGSELRKHIF